MNTEQIMSTPVVFTQPTVKVSQLKDMFARKHINATPVLTNDGEIAGIVTSSDLVANHDETLQVENIMSKKYMFALKIAESKMLPKPC